MQKLVLMCVALLLLVGCESKIAEMQRKHKKLERGMTTDQVNAIMGGEGKTVTTHGETVENCKIPDEKLNEDYVWVFWGEFHPANVLVAFKNDRMSFAFLYVSYEKK